MNLCNDPDHGALNAERAESRGLRKAWVDLDDKRQILERELAAMTEQRDELRRWTSVNGVIELQRERDEAREALEQCRKDYFELLGTSSKTKTKGYDLPWIDFAR